MILLFLLCILGIMGQTCLLQLDLVRFLCCSDFWYPFSSGRGFTVYSHRSCRGNRVLKLSVYEYSYLSVIILRREQYYIYIYILLGVTYILVGLVGVYEF